MTPEGTNYNVGPDDVSFTYAITTDQAGCAIPANRRSVQVVVSEYSDGFYARDAHLGRTSSAGDACEYTFTWPKSEDGPWARWQRVDRTNPNDPPFIYEPWDDSYSQTVRRRPAGLTRETVRSYYQLADISRFEPRFTIEVPDEPADRFATTTFAVDIARVGADTSCTATATANFIIEAGSNTAVPDPAHDFPLLVHDPDTSDSANTLCSYTATIPTSAVTTHADGSTSTLETSDSTTATIVDPTPVAVSYELVPPTTFFEPTVTLGVPQYDRDGAAGTNFYEGTSFEVSFTAKTGAGLPSSGCSEGATPGSAVTKNYVVDTAGAAVPDGGAPSLVDVPMRETDHCVYEVSVPSSVSSAQGVTPAWTLRNAGTTAQDVSTADPPGGSATVERRFDADTINFAPALAVTVPPVVGLTAGENLFAGHTFDVTVVRTSAADGACSLGSAETVRFTVDASGTATATLPATLASLVDRPQGQVARCAYEVTFPPLASSTSGAVLSWLLTPSAATATLGGGPQASATGDYAVGVVTFTPDVTIEVPQYDGDDDLDTQLSEGTQNAFTGRVVIADFERSDGTATGCEPVTKRYVVGSTGTVAPEDGVDAVLTHYPDGDTSSACVFGVFYYAEPGADPALIVDTADASTQASDLSTSAVYVAEASMFTPAVSVLVPFVDADDDDVNDLSGQSVIVRYTPVAGSDNGCLTESDTFAIEDAADATNAQQGTVMPPAAPASLVDRPRGVTARCTYAADATEAVTPTGASGAGTAIDVAAGSDNQQFINGGPAITISYGNAAPPAPPDQPQAPEPQTPAPQSPGPQTPAPQSPGGTARRPTATGGGGGGGRAGGSGGSPSAGLTGAGSGATGPFVPSATQRVPVGVSLTWPADTFSAPTPVEVLVNSPDECGTDVRTFDGLAAQVGVTYAFDAAASAPAGETAGGAAGERASPTAEIIAAGARHLAQFAERGTQQRLCALRVTLLSAPAGCTLRADASTADASTAADPAAPVLTDDVGRSYVELSFSDGTIDLNVTPALTCA